jgi:hypothetical protein
MMIGHRVAHLSPTVNGVARLDQVIQAAAGLLGSAERAAGRPVNQSLTIGALLRSCSMVHATVGIRAADRRRSARIPTVAWTTRQENLIKRLSAR